MSIQETKMRLIAYADHAETNPGSPFPRLIREILQYVVELEKELVQLRARKDAA